MLGRGRERHQEAQNKQDGEYGDEVIKSQGRKQININGLIYSSRASQKQV